MSENDSEGIWKYTVWGDRIDCKGPEERLRELLEERESVISKCEAEVIEIDVKINCVRAFIKPPRRTTK